MNMKTHALAIALTIALTASLLACNGAEETMGGGSALPSDTTAVMRSNSGSADSDASNVPQEHYVLDSLGVDAIVWFFSDSIKTELTKQLETCVAGVVTKEISYRTAGDDYSAFLTPAVGCEAPLLSELSTPKERVIEEDKTILWYNHGTPNPGYYALNPEEKAGFHFEQREVESGEHLVTKAFPAYTEDSIQTNTLMLAYTQFTYDSAAQESGEFLIDGSGDLFVYIDGTLIEEHIGGGTVSWKVEHLQEQFFNGAWEDDSEHSIHVFYLERGLKQPYFHWYHNLLHFISFAH